MTEPSPDRTNKQARQRLRTLRILDALSQSEPASVEQRYRDALLPLIGVSTRSLEATLDDLPSETIDATLSTALARVAEDPEDALIVLAACTHVLAADGQFARMQPLARRFKDLAIQIRPERPGMSEVLNVVNSLLVGDYRRSEHELATMLAPEKSSETALARNWTNLSSLYLSNALRYWLLDRSTRRLEDVISVSREVGDELLYSLGTSMLAFANYANSAATSTILSQADTQFGESKQLQNYLARRNVPVLLPAQLKAIVAGALQDRSKLIAMPTSSGKTFLAELRVAAELTREPGTRAIYLAPYRVLARQVERTMRWGLRAAAISVKDLGSDFDTTVDQQLAPGEIPDLAVMTPERMDALLRLATSERSGATEARNLLESVRVLVIDEAHLIARAGRGPRLEFLLTRVKRRLPQIDLVALSAAADGADVFASWLGDPQPVFGGRPPTGTIELLWRTDGEIVQNFDGTVLKVGTVDRTSTAIDSAASLFLQFRPDLHPILILETTRQNAENVVRKIHEKSPRAAERWRATLAPELQAQLEETIEEARIALGEHNDLWRLLGEGLAYHHAGVPPHLLRAIESLAEARVLRALGATTTVAEGAHLPFVVVVVPHLNFQGGTGRLENDLYLNIRGRAGRTGVAAEGLIVLLDSDSRTLRGHVERRLWTNEVPLRIRSRLGTIPQIAQTLDQREALRELDSQMLAWLGEGGEEVADQAKILASETFSWTHEPAWKQDQLETLLSSRLDELEVQGLVAQGSPFRLTPLGRRARLAGIGPRSCLRLHHSIQEYGPGRFMTLMENIAESRELGGAPTGVIADLVFQTEEVLENSLWFRRLPARTDQERASVLMRIAEGDRPWPVEDDLYLADKTLLALWIAGEEFADIGAQAPTFRRGIFSREDPGVRAADAAEYLGRMSYPASWAWAGAVAMLGSSGDDVPGWIRRGIEWGLPNETATELVGRLGLSRFGAIRLSKYLGNAWAEATARMEDVTDSDLAQLSIGRADISRFLQRREYWIPPSW